MKLCEVFLFLYICLQRNIIQCWNWGLDEAYLLLSFITLAAVLFKYSFVSFILRLTYCGSVGGHRVCVFLSPPHSRSSYFHLRITRFLWLAFRYHRRTLPRPAVSTQTSDSPSISSCCGVFSVSQPSTLLLPSPFITAVLAINISHHSHLHYRLQSSQKPSLFTLLITTILTIDSSHHKHPHCPLHSSQPPSLSTLLITTILTIDSIHHNHLHY